MADQKAFNTEGTLLTQYYATVEAWNCNDTLLALNADWTSSFILEGGDANGNGIINAYDNNA